MEKGYNPDKPSKSDFLLKLHQLIRDGQNELISFAEVRAQSRKLALSVLEQSEEGQKLLPFNMLLASPEKPSDPH